MAMKGETVIAKQLEWGHMKTNKISVEWTWEEADAGPVVSATGLEILAADRLLRFVRNNPNGARYSVANNPKSGGPITVL
jgi:hypothetical protein